MGSLDLPKPLLGTFGGAKVPPRRRAYKLCVIQNFTTPVGEIGLNQNFCRQAPVTAAPCHLPLHKGDCGTQKVGTTTQKTSLLYHRRGRYATGKTDSCTLPWHYRKAPTAAAGELFAYYILLGSPQVKPLAATPSMTSASTLALVLLTACSRYTIPGQALSTIFVRDSASSGWSSVSQSL